MPTFWPAFSLLTATLLRPLDSTNPDSEGDGRLDVEEDANHNGKVDEGESVPGIYTVEIERQSYPNCFNNVDHGLIFIAILGSGEFEMFLVDPSTMLLEGLEARAAGKADNLLAHTEDVNGDGREDLVS